MLAPNAYREFAHTIAPETTERPLYLLDSQQHEILEKPSRGCHGWADTVDHEEHELVEVIGGDWRGPGRVITMNTRAMLDFAGLDNFDEYAHALIVHELAHLLPWPHRPSRKVLDKMEAAFASPDFTPEEIPTTYPAGEDPYHGVDFARRCAHLWARAKAAGYDINPRVILTCGQDDQLLLETVIVHCAGEFISLKDKTFRDIQLHPMPTRLVEEWADNIDLVKSWERKRLC